MQSISILASNSQLSNELLSICEWSFTKTNHCWVDSLIYNLGNKCKSENYTSPTSLCLSDVAKYPVYSWKKCQCCSISLDGSHMCLLLFQNFRHVWKHLTTPCYKWMWQYFLRVRHTLCTRVTSTCLNLFLHILHVLSLFLSPVAVKRHGRHIKCWHGRWNIDSTDRSRPHDTHKTFDFFLMWFLKVSEACGAVLFSCPLKPITLKCTRI